MHTYCGLIIKNYSYSLTLKTFLIHSWLFNIYLHLNTVLNSLTIFALL